MNIVPELGQHGAIVGKTGSGKTTTACALLTAICQSYPVLIIDSKGDEKFQRIPQAIIVEKPSQLNLEGVEIYRPEGALNEPEALDAVLQKAYASKRNLYIYVDEAYQISDRARPGRGLSNCLMRGRHRNVDGRSVRQSIITCSQRPSWVPRHCYTESSHFYIHYLSARDDRIVMSHYVGSDLIEEAPIPASSHAFYYYQHKMIQPEILQINLNPRRLRSVS